MIRRLILAAIALALMPGCASITRGSTEAWTVETEPPGAEVRLSNGQICQTPCSLELPRKHGFTAEIERDGYERVTATVASSVAGGGAAAMAGNLLFGGFIGAAVDAGTGATRELRPNPLRVTLAPLPAPAAPPPQQWPQPAPLAPAPVYHAPSPGMEPADALNRNPQQPSSGIPVGQPIPGYKLREAAGMR